MSTKHDIELRAAAAAASVLGAQLIRRDVSGAQQTRDFDLVFPDGSLEPLEVTRHVDRAAYETWERLRRGAGNVPAPSLTRVWTVAAPSSTPRADGRQPYDIRRLRRELEPALAQLEQAGHTTIELGRVRREQPRAFRSLVDLGIQDGLSRLPKPGEVPHISIGSPVGGFTLPDLVAAAIEHEATDVGNQTKLAQLAGARRRHLFVVFDSSSGSAFNAVDRGLIGRLPTLPPPITTAWAATGGHVLMTTPPKAWERHELPRAVFDDPTRWLV